MNPELVEAMRQACPILACTSLRVPEETAKRIVNIWIVFERALREHDAQVPKESDSKE